MALHGRMLIPLQPSLLMAAVILAAATSTILLASAQALPPQAKPGCTGKCGNLTIPYPFGIEKGCYHEEGFYDIVCNKSANPPQALWAGGNLVISNFSLEEGEMQLLNYPARDCYDANGRRTNPFTPWIRLVNQFTFSHTKNKFVAVGCDTYALFQGFRGEEQYVTGCVSYCNKLSSVDQDSCSGVGCCQTNIPIGMKNYTIKLDSYNSHSAIWDFNPCSYALIVEEGHFKFSNTSFKELESMNKYPLVLNWAVGDPDKPDSCDAAQKRQDYECKGNSTCANPINRNGYICQCLEGYEGNPYIGCQDINECKASINPCKNGTCINEPIGSYSCKCNSGYRNENGNMKSCIAHSKTNNTSLKISLGLSISFFILLVGIFWIYCGMKRRKFNRLKKKYFEENGGTKLQQKLGSCTEATAKIFTEEELKKATNNYHADEILGEGGYGTVYKGTLPNKKVVAIKKSKINATSQSDQFVNEVIVLSQISHRNVVKLLGCCLETEMPLLVYEFVSNGTLYDHIHKRNGKGPLSLALRLKIAAETAESLSYLHYSTSMQIVHRDVKATNILLDEKFTAKVSDFGASKLVPEDEDQLSTLVQGTMGYLDPEYLQSNTLTEKSDVYSFGVVLVELLTSRRALSFDKPEAERSLANVFVCAVEDGLLNHILDEEVVKDGHFETVENVADLAKRCLSVKGSERPTMREVARELEGLQILPNHSGGGKPDSSPKETDYLLASPSNAYIVDVRGEGESEGDGGSITTSIEYDQSMKNQAQMLKPYDGGR